MAIDPNDLVDASAEPRLTAGTPVGESWLVLVTNPDTKETWGTTAAQYRATLAPPALVKTTPPAGEPGVPGQLYLYSPAGQDYDLYQYQGPAGAGAWVRISRKLGAAAGALPNVALALSAATVLPGAAVTLTATATSSTSTIAKVEFFDGPAKIGEVAAQPYALTYNPASVGAHALLAKATDAAGNSTTSAPQVLSVAAAAVAAPTATLSPIAPATVGLSLSLLAAATADPTRTIAKVEFYDGAQKIGESLAAPYGMAYAPSTAGTHYFAAKAIDSLGAATVSAVQSVLVSPSATAANNPPTVSLSATALALALGGSTTLSATAADSDGTVAKVSFFDGATKITDLLAPPYVYPYTPTTGGGHLLSAVATDNLGATASATLVVTVQAVAANQPPFAALNVGSSPVVLGQPTALTVTASDPDGTIAKVEIFADSSLQVKLAESATAPFVFQWFPGTTGPKYPVARATDNLGATYVSAVAFVQVNAAAAATTPPAVSLALSATTLAVGGLLTLTASATPGTSAVAQVQFYEGAALLGTSTAAPYAVTVSPAAGSHTYTAVVTDATGVATTSAAQTATVTAAPVITAPGAPTSPTATVSGTAITVSATAPANTGGAAITGYAIYRNGTLLVASTALPYTDATPVAGTAYAYTLAAVNSAGTGAQSASASATVPAGNPSFALTLNPGDNVAAMTWTALAGVQLRYNNPVAASSALPGNKMLVFYPAGTQVAGFDYATADEGHACAVVVGGVTYYHNASGGALLGFTNGSVTLAP